jgi:hypothetical protein
MVGWSGRSSRNAKRAKKYEEWYSSLSAKDQCAEDIYKELAYRKVGWFFISSFACSIVGIGILYALNHYVRASIFNWFLVLLVPIVFIGFFPPVVIGAFSSIVRILTSRGKVSKMKKLCKEIKHNHISYNQTKKSQNYIDLTNNRLNLEVLEVIVEELRQGNNVFNEAFFNITDTCVENFIKLPATRTAVSQVIVEYWDSVLKEK